VECVQRVCHDTLDFIQVPGFPSAILVFALTHSRRNVVPTLAVAYLYLVRPRAASHTSGELMFDHVKFGVSDYAASKAFFLKALEPLGVAVVSEGPPTYGVELSPKGKASLCLYQTEEKPAHLHLAFTAENRQQVEAFYRAALEAGGKDNGAPGLCPHYHANYYAAFVIGPDGHNIEVVCHKPEA
jgi:catechol 2,3-dioxygenase-like lactoylglutathione lyase family enzyme